MLYRLSMDELINALCLHMSSRKQVYPEDVSVELCWDERHGFTAEVSVHSQLQYLVESNLLEAIEQYMNTEYGQRVFRHQMKLNVDEEIWAEIDTDL